MIGKGAIRYILSLFQPVNERGFTRSLEFFVQVSGGGTTRSSSAFWLHNGQSGWNGHSGPLKFILFDLANTSAEDQLEAHKQLVRFLRALPSGQQVALFALTNKMTMIQNVTGSSDRLIEAARQIDPQDAGVIISKVSQIRAEDVAAEAARQSRWGMTAMGRSARDKCRDRRQLASAHARGRI